MSKIMTVVRREFISRVRTKAFVISTLLVPVMVVVLLAAQVWLLAASLDTTTRIALVDGSAQNVGQRISQVLNAQTLGSGADEKPRYEVEVFAADGQVEKMRDQLIAKVDANTDAQGSGSESWDGVLVIDSNTLASGEAEYYGDNVGSMTAMRSLESTLSQVLTTVRLAESGIDPAVVKKAMHPTDLDAVKVSGGEITGQSGAESFILAYVMAFILYIAVLLYGQQTMTSVIEEKTSRIMEVLASSLTPFQMLLGKVLGVGAAGLAQMAIWGGSIFILTTQSGHLAALAGVSPDAVASLPIPTMPLGLLIVFLVYFALGFLLYGALFAAIGSMCNTVQETQQYSTAVTMIIVVGFLAAFSMINNPTGALAMVLSFVPFFSPFTMPVRWSLTSVPWPQLVLSLALTVAALLACVWLAARIYRTGILMYGKKPSVKELWRWLRAD